MLFDQSHMQHVHFGTNVSFGYFNYALLHGTGFAHMLDVMRYQRAFLARKSDLELLLEATKDYSEWINRRYAILLCKYDFRGKTKPSWVPQQLSADQELEEVTDPMTLMQLGVDPPSFRPPKPLKVQHILALEGPIDWLLQVMFLNKAVPHNEADAHAMERAFYEADTLKVELTNYCNVKTLWTIPSKPGEKA